MKKLLILTALAMLTISSTGCGRMRSWWNRGAPCNECEADFVYGDAVIPPAATIPVLPGGTIETLPTP